MSSENDSYDYQRFAILFVDDEANSRKYFHRLFGRKFRILEASDGVEALDTFRQNAEDIAIIVTDQRMPNETGVGFLSKISGDYPDVIKILSTAYADIDAAIGSVNRGGIFRYITKPWDIPELEITLRRAMEFFLIKRERDTLLGAKMLALGNVLISNRLAAFAFVPVCSRVDSAHAAEAVAAFVRLGITSPDFSPVPQNVVSTPDPMKLHERQIELASLLESELPGAVAADREGGRISNLIAALEKSGAGNSTMDSDGRSFTTEADPFPGCLETILGSESAPERSSSAMRLMAAVFALYDDGLTITRKRGSVPSFVIAERSDQDERSPGSATAKWLYDDDLLVSAALGMI